MSQDNSQALCKLSDYVTLGNSGVRVSRICLGAMNFGGEWQGWIGDTSYEEAKKIFNKYCDLGGNFIDTANVYHNGQSEKWLGEFIKERGNRDELVIASKYTFNQPKGNLAAQGNNRKNMMYAIKETLKRLQTDSLDVLYVHIYDHITPIREIMRGLDDLVKQGKVHYLGISDTPIYEVAVANTMAEHQGWTPFTLYQGRHNIGDRGLERDIIHYCRKYGLAVCPWNILGAGKYLGKYDRKNGVPQQIRNNVITERDFEIQDVVVKIAKEVGRTPAQVVINWELQTPGITAPLIGSRTFQQFEDNVGGIDFTLSKEQMEELNKVAAFQIDFPYDFLGSSWETSPIQHFKM